MGGLSNELCQESGHLAGQQRPSSVLARAQCHADTALLFSGASPWPESLVTLPRSTEPELVNSLNPACSMQVLQPGMVGGE